VIFDWEPTLTSTSELITAPRGADTRIDEPKRRSSSERREEYFGRMDAKASARAELIREREAGMWQTGEEEYNGENMPETEQSAEGAPVDETSNDEDAK